MNKDPIANTNKDKDIGGKHQSESIKPASGADHSKDAKYENPSKVQQSPGSQKDAIKTANKS